MCIESIFEDLRIILVSVNVLKLENLAIYIYVYIMNLPISLFVNFSLVQQILIIYWQFNSIGRLWKNNDKQNKYKHPVMMLKINQEPKLMTTDRS